MTGLNAKSIFGKVFDLKKLQIIYCWNTSNFLWVQTSAFIKVSNKSYKQEMNFIENKYLTSLLMSCSGLLHVTVEHNLAD